MPIPSLIVITGRPASGKTTLAHELAGRIHCPAFSRDEFKEGYVNTANARHDKLGPDTNRDVSEAFFDAIDFMLSRGISLVAEAAFQHKNWKPRLEGLQKAAHVAIVICTIDAELARERFISRGLADSTREWFHGDGAVHAARKGIQLPLGRYDPPELPVPILRVDTSDGYDPGIDVIVSFAKQFFR